MIEVKRKENESFDAVLRRFTKRIQQSRILLRLKEERFYARPISKLKAKKRAMKGAKIKSQREYLKRIGRLPELINKGK